MKTTTTTADVLNTGAKTAITLDAHEDNEANRGARMLNDFHSRKLGTESGEQAKDLKEFILDKQNFVERVGWVINGTYGSEAMYFIKRMVAGLPTTAKARVRGLRTISIIASQFLINAEYCDLNRAKAAKVLTTSGADLEAINVLIAKEIEDYYFNNK